MARLTKPTTGTTGLHHLQFPPLALATLSWAEDAAATAIKQRNDVEDRLICVESSVVQLRSDQAETVVGIGRVALGNVSAVRRKVIDRNSVARRRPPAVRTPTKTPPHGLGRGWNFWGVPP